jgi:CBS domain containing-hemolysin-like protein
LAAAFFLFLFLTSLTAAAETAFRSLDRTRLRSMVEKGVPGGQGVERLLEDAQRSMIALLILNGLGLMGAASVATVLSLRLIEQGWVGFLFLAGVALLLLVLAQVFPKSVAIHRPEETALLVVRPVGVLVTLLWPLVQLASLIARLSGRIMGQPVVPIDGTLMISEEELRRLVNAGHEEATIDEEEKEMIAGIFELGETLAREVMVPRIDMVAVEADTPLLEALEVIIRHGHSRIPVYEGTIDHIIGILYAKDLLEYLRDGRTDVPLREIVREAYFIPESKHIDELLQEMQGKKVHIAIVVDEYGGTAGLVTIEDLLEEIVGEIQDEYDREEVFMERISEDEAIFNARMDLDDVNRIMSIELPTEQGDTLGGLIYSELGKIPEPGDRITVNGVTIEVLSVIGRRIGKVKVTRRGDAATEERSSQQAEEREGTSRAGLMGDVAA